ncbi:MAG: DUF3347 domain-containing protein [Chitinophagaceae bacterium]|nr:MAG: DUF3347 domain-containing protein [Chitinophagaceae bacterium]
MRKFIWIIALVAAGLGTYLISCNGGSDQPATPEPPKQQPVAQSKHSAAFNESVSKAMADYAQLQETLVNWDSASVKASAAQLQASLKGIAFSELQKDTAIYQTAASYGEMFDGDLTAMQAAPNLTEARRSFHSLSQNLYDLLRVIRYDASAIYLQECPMAFGKDEDEPGVWLSNTSAVRNPYMGLRHPRYGKTMLECGGPKDSLQFAPNK